MDYSNIQIGAQTAIAQGLINATNNEDRRVQIDCGKLIYMANNHSRFHKVFITGSKMPQPNDSIWKIEKNRLEVKLLSESLGKEKEVDTELTCQVMETLHELEKKGEENVGNVVFQVFSGDRDFKPPIKRVLERNIIRVELWSWNHSMSSRYTALSKMYPKFTTHLLDHLPHREFSSIDYMYKAKKRKRIDTEHALQCTDVPKGEAALKKVAEYFEQKNLLFYIRSYDFPEEDKQELIIEFPDISPDDVLGMISSDFKYHISKYGEIEGSQRNEVPPRQKRRKTASTEKQVEPPLTDQMVAPRCRNGDHCRKGAKCPFTHTKDEQELFDRHPTIDIRNLKTKWCRNLAQHTTDEAKKRCSFAHDNNDSWCLKCKKYGHFKDSCTE